MVNSETKMCPFCAEHIEVKTIKCRYCQSSLDEDSVAKIKKVKEKAALSEKNNVRKTQNKQKICIECRTEHSRMNDYCEVCDYKRFNKSDVDNNIVNVVSASKKCKECGSEHSRMGSFCKECDHIVNDNSISIDNLIKKYPTKYCNKCGKKFNWFNGRKHFFSIYLCELCYSNTQGQITIEADKQIKNLYDKLTENIKIPSNAGYVRCKKGLIPIEEDILVRFKSIDRNGYLVKLWVENDKLLFTYDIKELKRLFINEIRESSINKILNKSISKNYKYRSVFESEAVPLFSIRVDDILFYSMEGDFYVKSDTTGEGGGTDYLKALAGGYLFGAPGAIVASRKEHKIETVTTEVDKRETILCYKHDGKVNVANFDKDAFNSFKQLLPDKDAMIIEKLPYAPQEDLVVGKGNDVNLANQNSEVDDVFKKIEKLGALKKKGLITEEEFLEKKKKLLDLI